MKARYEKEQISKGSGAVLIFDQVGSKNSFFNHLAI